MASVIGDKRRRVSQEIFRKVVAGCVFDAEGMCDVLGISDESWDTAEQRDNMIWSMVGTLVDQAACDYVGDGFSGGCSNCKGHMMPSDAFCPSCGAEVVRREIA